MPDRPTLLKHRGIGALAGALLALTSCSEATGPHYPVDTQYRELLPCYNWVPSSPQASPIVVDLRVGVGPNEDREENFTPTDAEIAAVKAAGGTVIRSFHVDVIRALLDTDAIRRLVVPSTRIASRADVVLNPNDTQIQVEVFYGRTPSADEVDNLKAHGATIVSNEPTEPRAIINIADERIPTIAALPGVTFIRAYLLGCGTPVGDAVPSPNLATAHLHQM